MHVLVINLGSSSIKFSMFRESAGAVRSLAEGEVGGIGGRAAKLEFRDANGKDPGAKLALTVFVRSVVKTVAGLAAVHSPSAMVFTGGIGEHDAQTRGAVAGGLGALGAELDGSANDVAGSGVQQISDQESRLALYVVPAEEDLMIARHVEQMCRTTH